MLKVAWVSGGSGGIGSAICKELAEQGFAVAIGYYQGEQRALEIREACREKGVLAEVFQADLRSATSVIEQYERIRYSLGFPSVVVHAAGQTQTGLIQEVTAKEFDDMMHMHVRSAFLMVQSALPFMLRQQYGRIIFISSIWGETGGAGEVLYSMAKSALNGMARALAKELAPSGITVNAIAPGAIDTQMIRKQLSEAEQEQLKLEIPMGRLGEAREVASLVGYLAKREASYITGQVIHVNGGWYT